MPFTVFGTASNDVLTGTAGPDLIDGQAGADHMSGGTGDDTYVVDDAGDVVTEAANAGIDTIKTSISLAALAANVEQVVLLGAGNLDATGNALDNVMTGNLAGNTLNGSGGNDVLLGYGGA